MDSDTSAYVSAIAAIGSVAVAAAAFFVAWQARSIQRASADFTSCLQVVEQLRLAQNRIRCAKEEEDRTFEFNELLNLFEALALLHNDNKMAASTKKFVVSFLDQAIAWVRTDDEMTGRMDKSVTGDDTYAELDLFQKRRTREIAKHTRRFAIQQGKR